MVNTQVIWYSLETVALAAVCAYFYATQKDTPAQYNDFTLREVASVSCADGSPYRYYESLNARARHAYYLIIFEGGAVCDANAPATSQKNDESYKDACAVTGSATLADRASFPDTLLDRYMIANRYFFDFHFVYLPACDTSGNLVTSSRVLDALAQTYALQDAEKIVFGGAYTGGVAALLAHQHYTRKWSDESAGKVRITDTKSLINNPQMYTVLDSSLLITTTSTADDATQTDCYESDTYRTDKTCLSAQNLLWAAGTNTSVFVVDSLNNTRLAAYWQGVCGTQCRANDAVQFKQLLLAYVQRNARCSLWLSEGHDAARDASPHLQYAQELQHVIKRWVFDDERSIVVNGTYLNTSNLNKMTVDDVDGEMIYNPFLEDEDEGGKYEDL